MRIGLLNIGPLFEGVLIRRPSREIKSPYVANVKLSPQAQQATTTNSPSSSSLMPFSEITNTTGTSDGEYSLKDNVGSKRRRSMRTAVMRRRKLDSNNTTTNSRSSPDQQAREQVQKNTEILAWSPALDVGGLCQSGASVLLSERQSKKTTRKTKSSSEKRETTHTIQLVLAVHKTPVLNIIASGNNIITKEDDMVGRNLNATSSLVGANPSLGEKLAEEVLKKGLLGTMIKDKSSSFLFNKGSDIVLLDSKMIKELQKNKNKTKEHKEEQKQNDMDDFYSILPFSTQKKSPKIYMRRQVTHNDSRVDFELIGWNRELRKIHRCLIEIKNVVCAEYLASDHNIPEEKRSSNHCVIMSKTQTRSGLFPWGRKGQTYEGQKVVSERAIKHLKNLGSLVEDDERIKTSCMVLFVLNRDDCERMRACHEGCEVFADTLDDVAKNNGVMVNCFRVHWNKDGNAFYDGLIPVDLEVKKSLTSS